ncbi:MAG: hypothetical protein HWD58_18385 [Bacteroidota bacterium]|nr:MAG: hypothetical protein HWD58_18385 [Bacteroidota bacterium]
MRDAFEEQMDTLWIRIKRLDSILFLTPSDDAGSSGAPSGLARIRVSIFDVFIVKNLKFIFLYYINKNVLIPRYLANKKVRTYAWWLFVCFVLVFLWPTLSNWIFT